MVLLILIISEGVTMNKHLNFLNCCSMSNAMQMHLMHGPKASDSLGSCHPASTALGMRYSPVSPGARASLLPFESMLRSSIPETPDLERLSSSSNRDVDCSMASSSPSPMASQTFQMLKFGSYIVQ